MQTCLSGHTQCRVLPHGVDDLSGFPEILDDAAIPSRLLEICSTEQALYIRLLDTKNLEKEILADMASAGYVALSYCWGGDQPHKLTRSSYSKLQDGLSISELPKTLSDAVVYSDALGLRYAWVDSLCIFQDNEDDKCLEITRMASYYNRSIVTICAASAMRCTDGFLRTMAAPDYIFGPVRIRFRSEEGSGFVYLVQDTDTLVEPSTVRAWTLQESLLSRRILIFASRQLYWCCETAIAGCGGTIRDLFARNISTPKSLVPNIHPQGAYKDWPPDVRWKAMVKDYTGRHLNVESDKLLAISALAQSLNPIFKSFGEEPAYLAGLYVDLNNELSWWSQLMWYSKFPPKSSRPTTYRAPSWSWACMEGNIEYLSLPISLSESVSSSQGWSVVDRSIYLDNPSAPYGMIKGGYISAKAK